MYTKIIDPAWSRYDQSVAECQLLNFGVIFIDRYGLPIDDEDEQEDCYSTYLSESRF